MTEPRTSRRVARVVLLVLILALVAVALPTVPAVWEWAAYYGEWQPILKSQMRGLMRGTVVTACPPGVLSLPPRPQVIRDAHPLDAGKYSYLKAKKKHLRWLPGKDLLIRQIGKEEFQRRFPNPWSQLLQGKITIESERP